MMFILRGLMTEMILPLLWWMIATIPILVLSWRVAF